MSTKNPFTIIFTLSLISLSLCQDYSSTYESSEGLGAAGVLGIILAALCGVIGLVLCLLYCRRPVPVAAAPIVTDSLDQIAVVEPVVATPVAPPIVIDNAHPTIPQPIIQPMVAPRMPPPRPVVPVQPMPVQVVQPMPVVTQVPVVNQVVTPVTGGVPDFQQPVFTQGGF